MHAAKNARQRAKENFIVSAKETDFGSSPKFDSSIMVVNYGSTGILSTRKQKTLVEMAWLHRRILSMGAASLGIIMCICSIENSSSPPV
jgi:hypothetical protein